MSINEFNLVRHELIGLKVEIVKCTNKQNIGLKGIVIDETYNIIKIETKDGKKSIPKNITVFKFTLPNGKNVKVDGKLLVSRPEDRIKKKFPRW